MPVLIGNYGIEHEVPYEHIEPVETGCFSRLERGATVFRERDGCWSKSDQDGPSG